MKKNNTDPSVEIRIILSNFNPYSMTSSEYSLRFSNNQKDFVFAQAMSDLVLDEYSSFLLSASNEEEFQKLLNKLFTPHKIYSIQNRLIEKKFYKTFKMLMTNYFLKYSCEFGGDEFWNRQKMLQLTKDYMRRNFASEGLEGEKLTSIKIMIKEKMIKCLRDECRFR